MPIYSKDRRIFFFSRQRRGISSCKLAGITGENLRRGEIFCAIVKYLKESVFSRYGAQLNVSAFVHRDYRGLFRGHCPRITGFN